MKEREKGRNEKGGVWEEMKVREKGQGGKNGRRRKCKRWRGKKKVEKGKN